LHIVKRGGVLVGTITLWAFGYVPYAVYELSAVVVDGIISQTGS